MAITTMDPKLLAEFAHALGPVFRLSKPLKEIVNWPQRTYDNLYAVAVQLYNKKKYFESLEYFTTLIQLDINNAIYSLGAGACMQQTRNYPEAVMFYQLAIDAAPHDPSAYFFAAESCLGLERKDLAREYYKKTAELSGDKKEFGQMKNRAEALLSTLR